MKHGHCPSHEPTPVVAGEDGLLDAAGVEQADHVAGQMLEVIRLDLPGSIAPAVAALVRREHVVARLRQGHDLVTPRPRQLREAVAEDDRHPLPRFVDLERDFVRNCALACGKGGLTLPGSIILTPCLKVNKSCFQDDNVQLY